MTTVGSWFSCFRGPMGSCCDKVSQQELFVQRRKVISLSGLLNPPQGEFLRLRQPLQGVTQTLFMRNKLILWQGNHPSISTVGPLRGLVIHAQTKAISMGLQVPQNVCRTTSWGSGGRL